MRILLIEDEENACVGWVAVLGKMGHTVDVAADAEAAVAMMGKTSYDLVLLDIMLPGGVGFADVSPREVGSQLLVRLRGGQLGDLKTRQDVPVVALTAVTDLEVFCALRNGGAARVLQKPIDAEKAVSEIADLLGGSADG